MKIRKLVFIAIMISISVVLSIIETAISGMIFIVPGVKLGLANVVTLIILMTLGEREAFLVVFTRILIVALTYSGLFSNSFWISITGGMLAILAMILIKKTKLSLYSISVFGSLMHMVGQITAAIIVSNTETLIYLLPYMIALSVPTGLITAYLANKVIVSFKDRIRSFN
ncbi:MAG: heptaprenyl diphosphate synthase [Tenericutes bacterium HGW-Tenericutes-5]|nr:MAG: heptaprenyl diphosphate synthase [Tenericutes bacterium HGW-Tenericutes-5]